MTKKGIISRKDNKWIITDNDDDSYILDHSSQLLPIIKEGAILFFTPLIDCSNLSCNGECGMCDYMEKYALISQNQFSLNTAEILNHLFNAHEEDDFIKEENEWDPEITSLLLEGLKFFCEERRCGCHTECKVADKKLQEIKDKYNAPTKKQ